MKAMRRIVVLLLLSLASAGICAGAEPIVIGQSLPLSSGSDIGRRILAGAEAYVRQVNGSGGVHGRRIALLTFDDGGDPQRHAANLRSLAAKQAVVLLNCLGDRSCHAAVAVAGDTRLPLVGPISGSRQLRTARSRYVFPVRPGYEREVIALAQQLRTIGTRTLAIVTAGATDAEPVADLLWAAAKVNIAATPIRIQASDATSLVGALKKLTQQNFDAVALDLDENSINALAQQSQRVSHEWPPMLFTLTSASPTLIGAVFRDRMVGFTSVVPNPETSSRRLAVDLVRQAERTGLPEAVSFEGLEAYLNTKICVEALRRAGPGPNPEKVLAALETLRMDAGDFPVSFGDGRQSGSDFLEIGVRSRDGKFVR